MSRTAVKQALKTNLSAVSGINQVYTSLPRSQTGMKFPSIVMALGKTLEKVHTLGNPGRRRIGYIVTLYIQTIDANPDEIASQQAFDDLLDSIDTALRADKTLGGTVLMSAWDYIDTDVMDSQLAGQGNAIIMRAIKTFDVVVEIIA